MVLCLLHKYNEPFSINVYLQRFYLALIVKQENATMQLRNGEYMVKSILI